MLRPPDATHLITGATGFVGAALTLELLRAHPRDRALCLVRGRNPLHARRRLVQAVTEAADAYGVPRAELHSIVPRLTALRGDITARNLGLPDTDRETLLDAGPLKVWHSAASLKDTEEALREILLHNVTGTENLLETLLPRDVRVFNHISTAYVSGRTSGVIAESLQRPRGFSNRYEQSKHYGEMMVADHCAAAGVPFRILRPGIVIGHSGTGRATGYTGFLGWVLKLAALDELSGGALHQRPLRYLASPDVHINVIPVDSIVEDCVGIDAAGAEIHNRVFHLTNTAPPTVGWMTGVITDTLGLPPVEFVTEESDLDPVSQRFHKWTRFERPYVSIEKEFSRAESDRLYPCARHGLCPLDADLMNRMVRLAVEDYRRKQAMQKSRGAA